MNIGEQIMDAVSNRLLMCENKYLSQGAHFIWHPSAAEQLEAVVEAQIEERVRVRLELDKDKLFNRALELIMSEWGKTRPEALDWLSRDEEWTAID